MTFPQSDLIKSIIESILKGYSKESIIYQSSLAEKKIISSVFEKKTVGDKILALDLHSSIYSTHNNQFNFSLFCKYLLEAILNQLAFNEVNKAYSVLAEFNAHFSDFLILIDKGFIEIYAENNEGEGFQITDSEVKQILSKEISFEEFGVNLYSSISVYHKPLPTSLSISEKEKGTLIQFTEKTFINLNVRLIWEQVFKEVGQFYENIFSTALPENKKLKEKKENNEPKKHDVLLSAFLKESSKTYQELFEGRATDFISNTEATIFEFIELEIEFFDKCQYDLENFESSIDGFAHLGATAFSVLNKIVNEISYETFHFATKRKLEFLEVRKQKFVTDNTIHLEFHDGLSEIGEDEDKFNRQYKGVIADNFIKNFKNQNKGLPKDEKVNTLRQTIINSTVSPNPRFDQVTAKELDIFLKEIESNPEAYENKTIDPKFIPFVYDRPLDWYFNAKNIPNQDLVFATYDYFNEGRRKDLFDALFFLNFMYCQFDMVKLNFETPFKILDNLKALPINKEEQHILLGFILKWFGGYPVNNMNAQFDTTLRLIEREFLNYPIETSEKKFCHRDMNDYVRKKELENYLNLKINNPDIEIPIPESFKTTIAKEKTDAVSNVLPQNSEPYFVDEYKIQIVEILKPYFDTNQHDSLNDLIFSFKKPTKKLFFKSNGNRLADAFKTLFEENIITQCNKKQLESWIKLNFTYHNTAGEKNFEAKYLNDIISRQFSNCKKPLLYLSKNEEAEKVLKKT